MNLSESLPSSTVLCGLVASTPHRRRVRERERTSVFFLVEPVTETLIIPAYFPFACWRAREKEWFLLYSAKQCSEPAVPYRAVDECCSRATACWVRTPLGFVRWRSLLDVNWGRCCADCYQSNLEVHWVIANRTAEIHWHFRTKWNNEFNTFTLRTNVKVSVSSESFRVVLTA